MTLRALIAIAVFVVLATAAGARPEDGRLSEARLHYESGMAHFHLQEYDAAISEFAAAYRLRPDPVFLYNLAQAHRLAGHAERALYFYRDYLRASPDSAERGEVEARIADLQAQLEAKKAEEAKKTMTPPAPATLAPVVAPPPASARVAAAPERPRPNLYQKWWLWTAVGAVVVAGVAVGVSLAVVPKNASIPGNTDGNIPVTFH